MEDNTKIKASLILKIISYCLLLGILTAIFNEKSTEKKKFKYIYYVSKILTIKSLIVNSHYSELLDYYSSSGTATTISTGYRNLLKLVKNKNECIANYKPCGILDT